MSDQTDTEIVRWREIFAPAYASALVLVCVGVWLHAADGLLVSTMMPAIVADIGGTSLIHWTIALYEIGSIIAGAASGLLSLRYNLKFPMAAAAVIFAFGCALSAIAPEMWLLLLGRLFQGLGGGGLMALSFVAVSLLFPKRLVARAMGAVSTIWAVSAFFGPLIGGLFVEHLTWRAGFWFFAIQATGLAIWVLAMKAPQSRQSETDTDANFPIMRLLWLSAGVICVAYAGSEISIISTPLFVIAGIVCLGIFLKLDSQAHKNRLLPKNPLNLSNPVGAALVMIACFAAATIAIGVYVPFLITKIHGVSALVAGYIVAIEAIVWTIAAVVISGAPERHDPKLILTGMIIVTLSIVGLAYAVAAGPIILIAAFAALQGLGFGTAWTFILRRATSIAPKDETQRVSGAIPTVQRLGYALGAAYIGIVANATGITTEPGNGTLELAASAIFMASLPVAAIGLFAALNFIKQHPKNVTATT